MHEPHELELGPAAILIVNGGARGRAPWLELCLGALRATTPAGRYRLYVWNNDRGDARVPEVVGGVAGATLLQADPEEALAHPHAVPLQRLYERARADGLRWFVALDSDAFPIREGWLQELHDALRGGAAVAGIWRDELEAAIEPYVHASCLAACMDFVEGSGLRLDATPRAPDVLHDTLSELTRRAVRERLRIHPWKRSNVHEVHRVIAGVYGDRVYHHGAGSRPGVQFWDEPAEAALRQHNVRVRDGAASLLFASTEPFVRWLRGRTIAGEEPRAILVLGMHRSGTSSLAGALERSGLHLGAVSRRNLYNPKGNHELERVNRLNDAILASSGGRWDDPPERIRVSPEQRRELAGIVDGFAARPFGIKDPRLLLTLEAWLDALPDVAFVGSFRHPAAVVRSLRRRDENLAEERAVGLWLEYNRRLVALHRRRPFPLLEFDLSDGRRYRERTTCVAIELGLRPDPETLREFLSTELDHHGDAEAAVPPRCAEVWDYLRAHAHRPAETAFAPRLLDLLRLCGQAPPATSAVRAPEPAAVRTPLRTLTRWVTGAWRQR